MIFFFDHQVVALAMPALVGAMGLAAEISTWRFYHRGLQNAADAAEAKAVSAQYGFDDGTKPEIRAFPLAIISRSA